MTTANPDTLPAAAIPEGWSVLDGGGGASCAPANRQFIMVKGETDMAKSKTGKQDSGAEIVEALAAGALSVLAEASENSKATRKKRARAIIAYATIYDALCTAIPEAESDHSDRFNMTENGSVISVTYRDRKATVTRQRSAICVKQGRVSFEPEGEQDWQQVSLEIIQYLLGVKPK